MQSDRAREWFDTYTRDPGAAREAPAAELGQRVLAGVEAHAREPRFADDLTVLILGRRPRSPSHLTAIPPNPPFVPPAVARPPAGR